ncbi:MAG: tRNA 4-thiouridine(8) synthase ThiI [Bdellovibrionales bacterium GWB1_55_8]|nr:MAG: tRNA 4-thiouridine(8) synthase ThiI [Bdellovibrionales bacterium GWB1_55_8]
MNKRAIVLRYHEVALKGANRGWFEERLAINARKLVARAAKIQGEGPDSPGKVEVTRQHGRILLHIECDASVRQSMKRLFGISSASPIRFVPTDKEALLAAAFEEVRDYMALHGTPKSFRVLTKRSDKALPETSIELDHFIGGNLKEAFPEIAVDLENPEMILGLEIRRGESFIWTEKIPGPGGLPVGTNARILALLSGGIDSPVAAIQILKRGSPVSYVHFHGAPFVGEDVLEKIEDLVRVVNRYQPDPEPLQIVPFGKLQEQIALVTNPKMRTVLYRRMMIRIACRLARTIGAHALATGESLGQVASQTVENIAAVDSAADLPILRPLITYDKDDIIVAARKCETFDISIRPGIDCCTLFADRHPSLRTTHALVQEQESRFDVNGLMEQALASVETRRVR